MEGENNTINSDVVSKRKDRNDKIFYSVIITLTIILSLVAFAKLKEESRQAEIKYQQAVENNIRSKERLKYQEEKLSSLELEIKKLESDGELELAKNKREKKVELTLKYMGENLKEIKKMTQSMRIKK